MEDNMNLQQIYTQPVQAVWLQQNNVQLDVLRLDTMHTAISGNKWFKLNQYLADAINKNADTVATFGGAYSNHIVAVACACRNAGLKSMGIIRGETPAVLSHSLIDASRYGMKLYFVSRAAYKEPAIIQQEFKDVYWISEGGYGIQGAKGAADILSFGKNIHQYTHIICAAGTGTMMAGLIRSAAPNQKITGISAMKGNYALHEQVTGLLDEQSKSKSYQILHDYHFGGYAKHPPRLLDFMNNTWLQHRLPTDIVYTSKTLYAIQELIVNNTINPGSNVLMIHSGGLQGNRSLPEGTLLF